MKNVRSTVDVVECLNTPGILSKYYTKIIVRFDHKINILQICLRNIYVRNLK